MRMKGAMKVLLMISRLLYLIYGHGNIYLFKHVYNINLKFGRFLTTHCGKIVNSHAITLFLNFNPMNAAYLFPVYLGNMVHIHYFLLFNAG